MLVPPDAEAAITAELTDGLAAAGLPPVPIASQLPAEPLPGSFLRVLAAGGLDRDPVTDQPTLIVECYSDDPAIAARTAILARGVLMTAAGVGMLGGTPCYGVRLVEGTVNLPNDDVPDRVRYAFTISTDLRMAVA